MTENERERLIRQYAAGEITWHSLRECGFDNYVEVLGALGDLGLRPPVAPMEGPNRAARVRGCAIIREALRVQNMVTVHPPLPFVGLGFSSYSPQPATPTTRR